MTARQTIAIDKNTHAIIKKYAHADERSIVNWLKRHFEAFDEANSKSMETGQIKASTTYAKQI